MFDGTLPGAEPVFLCFKVFMLMSGHKRFTVSLESELLKKISVTVIETRLGLISFQVAWKVLIFRFILFFSLDSCGAV